MLKKSVFATTIIFMLASCSSGINSSITRRSGADWILGAWLENDKEFTFEFFANGEALLTQHGDDYDYAYDLGQFDFPQDNVLAIHSRMESETWTYDIVYSSSRDVLVLIPITPGENSSPYTFSRTAHYLPNEQQEISDGFLVGNWAISPNDPGNYIEFGMGGRAIFYRKFEEGIILDVEETQYSILSPFEITMTLSAYDDNVFQGFAPSSDRLILFNRNPGSLYIFDFLRVK